MIAPAPIHLDLLTNSRMSSLKTCPKRHYFAYELGLRKDRDATPLRMGSAFHLGLDLRAQGLPDDQAIAQAVAGYDSVPSWAQTDEQVTEWLLEREIVARLLSGYFWRWPAGDVEVVATELAFDLPIRNPETGGVTSSFRLAGKIDKVVRLSDGRLAVMEHKTTGDSIEPDSDYWPRLRLDQQISLYMIAARELGHDVQTVLYDVARKPGIRPRKLTKQDQNTFGAFGIWYGESFADDQPPKEMPERETVQMFGARLTEDISERPDFYFARQEIPRLEADLDEFRSELWQIQQQLRESQRSGRWYRNTNACLHPFKCEFFELCVNGHTGEDVPSGYVRLENVHPELAEVSQ